MAHGTAQDVPVEAMDRICEGLEVAYGLVERAGTLYLTAASSTDERVIEAIGAVRALLAEAVERLRQPASLRLV